MNSAHLIGSRNALPQTPFPDAGRANFADAQSHRFVVKTVKGHVVIKLHANEDARIGHTLSSPFWVARGLVPRAILPGMGNGLKSLREGRGWNQQQAADQFGYSFEGYKKIEYGKRRLSAEIIERACAVYGVSEAVVMGRPDAPSVKLVGYIGAGNAAHYYANGDDPNEEVERPPESNEATVAAQVRGDSMYPVADDGDLIYFDDKLEPPTDDLIGKLCVVGLLDDRILVKRLYRGRAGLYNLTSANAPPMQDVPVVWARPREMDQAAMKAVSPFIAMFVASCASPAPKPADPMPPASAPICDRLLYALRSPALQWASPDQRIVIINATRDNRCVR